MNLPGKINLGIFPTPVHKLENLSKKFGVNLWIKRDDLNGLGLGGNKIRKLEYLVKHALEKEDNTLVTVGSAQSNHARQTAAVAAKLGLDCHLILRKPEPDTFNGNLLLDALFGATIHWTDKENEYKEVMKVIGALKDCRGKKPYFIPVGGSNEYGLLGYVNAAQEIAEQEKHLGFNFDFIVFASSSGGTQAGLIAGKKFFNLKAEILGVEIDKNFYPEKSLKQHILTILDYAKQEFDWQMTFDENDVKLLSGYNSAGYGVLTELEKEAIYTMASSEGIVLDPVYTGRAFGALLDRLKNNSFKKGSSILFVHTGGTPANFAYADKLYQKPRPGEANKNLLND